MEIPKRPKDSGDFGNDIVVRGNIGKDPEMSYTPDGKARCTFSVAVWAGKMQTMWMKCAAWEELGEACNEQLMRAEGEKTKYVEVKGYLSETTWKGQRYFTLNVKHVCILLSQPAVVVTKEKSESLPDSILQDGVPF